MLDKSKYLYDNKIMSTKIKTKKNMNVRIRPEIILLAKEASNSKGMKFYAWIEQALQEKAERQEAKA